MVEKDRDTMLHVDVDRDFTINQEHWQRAKVLSSKQQRAERRDNINKARQKTYDRAVQLRDSESLLYQENESCEQKVLNAVNKLMVVPPSPIDNQQYTQYSNFESVVPFLTTRHFGLTVQRGQLSLYPTVTQLKAFYKVRHPRSFRGSSDKPQYCTPPTKKADLIQACLNCAKNTVIERHFNEPVTPLMLIWVWECLLSDTNADNSNKMIVV